MRKLTFALLAFISLAGFGGGTVPGEAQTITCYAKKCVEYPDGTRICERTQINCDLVSIE
jgi:hypothetical protein